MKCHQKYQKNPITEPSKGPAEAAAPANAEDARVKVGGSFFCNGSAE